MGAGHTHQRSIPQAMFSDNEVLQEYVCPICQEVSALLTAMEHIQCGAIFCKQCLEIWNRTNDTCPKCREKASSNIRLLKDGNKVAYRIMSKLQVRCVTGNLDGNKCNWIGELEFLNKHLEICEYETISCPFSLQHEIPRKKLKEHKEKECEFRLMKCQYCERECRFHELLEHENNCNENPNRIRPCKYAYVGCTFKDKGEAVIIHEEEEDKIHLQLALKTLDAYICKK